MGKGCYIRSILRFMGFGRVSRHPDLELITECPPCAMFTSHRVEVSEEERARLRKLGNEYATGKILALEADVVYERRHHLDLLS